MPVASNTNFGWFYRRDAAALGALAASLGLTERELVKRVVHAYLSAPQAPPPDGLGESETEEEARLQDTFNAAAELFHEFVEASDTLMLRTDARFDVSFVNQASRAFFGVAPEAMLGQSLLDWLPEADRGRWCEAVAQARHDGQPRFRLETGLCEPGPVRFARWSVTLHRGADGAPGSYTVTGWDVTEQREAEALHERNQQVLLGLIKQEAFSGTDLNDALKAMTEVAARTSGADRASIWLYKDNYSRIECLDLFKRGLAIHVQGDELCKDAAPAYFRALETDRVVAAGDACHDARTAELRGYLEQNGIRAMLDAPLHVGGKTAGVFCLEASQPRVWTPEEQNFAASLGDMASLVFEQAERRRAEIEIIRKTVALEKAKELTDTMAGFVSMVAHEFRSPITALLGFIELIEEHIEKGGHPGSKEIGGYLQQLRQSVDRLSRLVDDLVDFSRLETGTFKLAPQEADLAAKVREVVATFYPQALAARVQLDTELPPGEMRLAFDPMRIGQVLANFIGNAIKFTPPGGRVVVRAAFEDDAVRVEVHDSGISIDPEDLPRLFTRFSQLSAGRSKGGMGLGLYIAKSLVQAHGGEVGIESAPGQGSTFWFTLPRH